MKRANNREMELTSGQFRRELRKLANPKQAALLQRFFKTGPGEYAEGDRFLGIKVPAVRALVRQFRGIPIDQALELVHSEFHEERFAGLLLWVQEFEGGDQKLRKKIFRLYLANARQINNWDLVDCTAPQIVGGSVSPMEITLLEKLAKSKLLWERRIAILATFVFIRQDIFGPTLQICEALLGDQHDLMHKACGWMLREVGKRDRPALSGFLDQHAAIMPRTMLRYALEHFDLPQRQKFMRQRALKNER